MNPHRFVHEISVLILSNDAPVAWCKFIIVACLYAISPRLHTVPGPLSIDSRPFIPVILWHQFRAVACEPDAFYCSGSRYQSTRVGHSLNVAICPGGSTRPTANLPAARASCESNCPSTAIFPNLPPDPRRSPPRTMTTPEPWAGGHAPTDVGCHLATSAVLSTDTDSLTILGTSSKPRL